MSQKGSNNIYIENRWSVTENYLQFDKTDFLRTAGNKNDLLENSLTTSKKF